jgi:Fe-S cluster biogenesis protein NfuA
MNDETSYSFRGKDGTRIRVTADPSLAHANICRFSVEPALYPEAGAHFAKGSDLSASPLAERLFKLGNVTSLVIAGSSITLTMDEATDWSAFSSEVAQAVRDQIDSGVPSVADSFTKSLPSSETVRAKVQEVIDTAVNPAVASHGGIVTLLDVKGNNVFLEFGGGCQGCGMVSVTLKYGVERLLREQVPEVGEILDTTDHAAGTNPYYAPSAK